MLSPLAIGLTAVAVLFATWHAWFRRVNRRRGSLALRWIEAAFEGHGRVVGVHWTAPCRVNVQLRLGRHLFHHACVRVNLLPRESPLGWLRARWQKRREIVTFSSDLELPPDFELQVENHRWSGRTRRTMPPASRLYTERTTPFMITTRSEWQQQTSMMDALIASRERDFLSVSYRRQSPHFIATLPLECIAPASETCSDLFDVLCELAGAASASRM